MKMGLLMFLGLVLALPQIGRAIEWVLIPNRPAVVSATAFRDNDDVVKIEYTNGFDWPISAYWVAQLRDSNDVSFYTAKSARRWSYSRRSATERVWEWGAFWENYEEPKVPSIPFKICVRYDGVGKYGTPFSMDYQCGEVFQP
jgi:hypothetical protein